ncbi:MAG: DUF4040 domain-containing protein [Erysipelotrichaceae bacterium]|jgi:uncharacterized MnhB-related membrane protein|nr:DUF4040 domain-containing protein [Erysipelotrichaceae bacterium]
MIVFKILLLVILVICAISVAFVKNNLAAVVVYMSSSCVMTLVWILLESPDLAITEAAVGAGITSVLFFITLKKLQLIDTTLNSINSKKEEGESDEK